MNAVKLFSALFLFCFQVHFLNAATLPGNLNQSDRLDTLKILGFGTAAGALSNPSHLGGYSGVEMFFTNQELPYNKIQTLGNQTGSGTSQSIMTLGVGKGLFLDIDSFVYFTPFLWQSKISNSGFLFRRKIFEDKHNPLQVSFQFHGSVASFSNKVGTTTSGIDLVTSYFWDRVAASLVLGQGRSIGMFTGGVSGITDTGDTLTEDLQQRHWGLGLCYRWNQATLSVLYDRYYEGIYSTRVAWRF